MSRPRFEVHAVSAPGRAAGIGDICVTISHSPTSTIFMPTAAEAEALALRILQVLDELRGRPLFREGHPYNDPAALRSPLLEEPTGACGHAMTGSCSRCTREEPTRIQCRKCLKDCAACTCAEDVISRGKGA